MARAGGKDRGIFERPKGSKIWWILYACQYGHIHRKKIGPKGLAKTEYERHKVRARTEGYCPTQERNKPRPILFQDFEEEYLGWSRVNKRSHKTDEQWFKRLREAFKGKTLDEITTREIEGFKSQLAAELAPATVNRHLALLKHMYTLALRWGKAKTNPVKTVRLFKENNARVRYLTENEEARLFLACPERYRPIVTIALHTGLRQGELLRMRWRDVDFGPGILTVERSKHGEALRVPMNSLVKETLYRLPRNGHQVFAWHNGRTPSDVSHAFAEITKRAGISDFRFHDLRHTFASRLVMAGVDIRTVQELLGHKTIQMTLRYTHLSPDHKQAAVERLIPRATGTATSTGDFEGVKVVGEGSAKCLEIIGAEGGTRTRTDLRPEGF